MDIHPATKEQRNILYRKMREAGYYFNHNTMSLEKFQKPDLDNTNGTNTIPQRMVSAEAKEAMYDKPADKKPADKKGMNLVEDEMTPFQKKVFCIIDTAIEEEQGLKQVCDELFALASNEIKQKSAWSEEDDNCLSTIIAEFSKCAGRTVSKDEWMRCNDFLNFLRDRVQPQSKQEWGEEDENSIHVLKDIVRHSNEINENITNNPNANSVLVRNGCVTLGILVEDFKKYMKGE